MKRPLAIGLVVLGMFGCSAGGVHDGELVSTSSSEEAIAADPFLTGRDLVKEDPSLRIEIAGVEASSIRLRSLRLRPNGDTVVVGDIVADGLTHALFGGAAGEHRVTEVIVTRGDGVKLMIGDIVFTPRPNLPDHAGLHGGRCPNGCSGHGVCLRVAESKPPTWSCACIPGFSGDDCSVSAGVCPGTPTCSDHGVCVEGTCTCLPGYLPPDCARLALDLP